MHSHIWFHHVSPCPAVSPRRWAGHHPVRHPVQGSQTASEWLIIHPGSLRPPNKNLNRSPKKKNSNKNWMVTLNCQASSSPNQVGANLWTIWDPKKRARLQALPLPQHWLFGRDYAPREKCWGLSWSTISEILLYMTSQYQSTKRQHRVLNTARVILLVLFLEEPCVFQDSILNIPMLGSLIGSRLRDHFVPQMLFWKMSEARGHIRNDVEAASSG